MIKLLEKCFPERYDSWRDTLASIAPSIHTESWDTPAIRATLDERAEFFDADSADLFDPSVG